jgi:hypothetical protein
MLQTAPGMAVKSIDKVRAVCAPGGQTNRKHQRLHPSARSIVMRASDHSFTQLQRF